MIRASATRPLDQFGQAPRPVPLTAALALLACPEQRAHAASVRGMIEAPVAHTAGDCPGRQGRGRRRNDHRPARIPARIIANIGAIAHPAGMTRILFAILCLAAPAITFAAPSVPAGIASQLPAGYEVLSSVPLPVTRPARIFQLVALGRIGESSKPRSRNPDARPLLIFERRNERFVLVGRNDAVILKADQGGQCDPFLDNGGTISVKGRFFTVENGVACGQHWTDFVTFRLDDRSGFVFDNERLESWSLNASQDPDAEALVPDGPQRIRRAAPGHRVAFSQWRRPR